jgi:uncharacterized OB-fold protein
VGDAPFRILPRVNDENRFFWTSGEDGRLRFLRCDECGFLVHPPSPICPECLCKRLTPTAVSGRATVATFTVNHQPWIPGYDPPYVVALVEIDEQPSVRLMTNIVGCAPDDVRIGMPVQVTFEHHDDVWLPLFEPTAAR